MEKSGENMLTYGILREIQKRELDSAAIVSLDKDFYEQLQELLAKKKKEAMESGSLLSIKEYENIKTIATSIYSRREEKILLMAIRGETEIGCLSDSENSVLKEVSEIISKWRMSFKGMLSDDQNNTRNIHRLRILNDVEAYTGLDRSIYGPFRRGQELSLNKDEAEWLLKAKMAELIR